MRVSRSTGWLSALWIGIALAAALVSGAVLVWDLLPWVRGPAPYPPEWRWLYRPLGWEHPWRQTLHLALLAGYCLAVPLLAGRVNHAAPPGRKSRKWDAGMGIAVAVLFLFVWQLAQIWVREESVLDTLIFRVYAPPLNGYFVAPAQVESISHTLHHYLQSMPDFYGERPRTHPPGLFLFYAGFQILFQHLPGLSSRLAAVARTWAIDGRDWVLLMDHLITSALTTAWVQIGLTSLTPMSFYAFLRQLSGSKGSKEKEGTEEKGFALWAALLYPLLAAPTLFVLQWDTLYPALGFGAWFFALRAQERTGWKRPNSAQPVSASLAAVGWDWVWAGLLLSLLTWLSFGTIVLGGMIGLHLIWRQWERRSLPDLGRFALGGGLMAAGVILPWLLAYVGWGMNFFALLQFGLNSHYDLVTTHRDYAIWWWMNLVDFSLWMGPALIFLALVGTGQLLRARLTSFQGQLLGVAVIFWTVLILLDLSGSTRGEIGRLWIFLMPIPLLLALTQTRTVGQRTLLLGMMALNSWSLSYALAPFLCC